MSAGPSSPCSRSVRPLHRWGAERGEVLGGGAVAEGLVRPDMIVVLLPSPQRRPQRGQLEIAVVERPELGAVGAVDALHMAVELGRPWGQDEEGNRPFLTGRLELEIGRAHV